MRELVEVLARAWFQSRHPQYGPDGLDTANDWWKQEAAKAGQLQAEAILAHLREVAADEGVRDSIAMQIDGPWGDVPRVLSAFVDAIGGAE